MVRALGIFIGFGLMTQLGGCGDDAPPEPDAASTPACITDDDCDDGSYCNGAETCEEGTDGPECVAGASPCEGACDEDADECVDACANPDADGDGASSPACGGSDCDDANPNRFPGNVEVCDTAGVDEDCNPATLGPDGDGDGEVSVMCCQLSDARVCGTDCDDALSGVNTGAIESCNGRDDDCDGMIDEGVQTTFYRDLDGDGFGISSDTQLGCSAPIGYAVLAGDCDDTLSSFNPSVPDGPTLACDGLDNNCDGSPDTDCMCVDSDVRPCGPMDGDTPITAGICRQGTQSCNDAMWDTCVNAVFPEVEVCSRPASIDEDCDGSVDEGLLVDCYPDADDDTYAAAGASVQTRCVDPTRTSVGGCPHMFTNRTPTTPRPDCNDVAPAQSPGASEICANGIDDDCDNQTDEQCTCMCSNCPLASIAPRTELSFDVRRGPIMIEHAGYRFTWAGDSPRGNARVDIECAGSPGTSFATGYECAGGAPFNPSGVNHEMYLSTLSLGADGGRIAVSIIRQ